jgi:chromosome segregation ATPase
MGAGGRGGRAAPRLDAGWQTVEDPRVPSPKAKPSAPTADEVPVTRGMLTGVRTELFQRIDQGREEARAENQRLDGKIDAVRAEIHELRAELKGDIHRLDATIHEVKAEIHEVKAEIHEVKAGMARIEVLVEEQNARNRSVLDGITALLSRQNQVEQRVVQVEDTVRKLAAAPSAG